MPGRGFAERLSSTTEHRSPRHRRHANRGAHCGGTTRRRLRSDPNPAIAQPARYGVITLLDDEGRLQDFLSFGMTAEEARQLWELPDGMRLFEYLGSITEPLWLLDLLGHIRSLGLPELHPPLPIGPVVSFLAAPILPQERAGGRPLHGREGEWGSKATELSNNATTPCSASGVSRPPLGSVPHSMSCASTFAFANEEPNGCRWLSSDGSSSSAGGH